MYFHLVAVIQYVGRSKPFTASHWLILNVVGACVVAAGVSYYRMIDQVNEKMAETDRFSKWQRDPFTYYRLMKAHRKLYPESRLRTIHLVGTAGMLAMFVAMIFFGSPF